MIDGSPTPLMESVEGNLDGHVSFVQKHMDGMHVDERPELLVVDSGLASDMFNEVLRARLNETNADTHIAHALAYFREAGRPFTWLVGPCLPPHPDEGASLGFALPDIVDNHDQSPGAVTSITISILLVRRSDCRIGR